MTETDWLIVAGEEDVAEGGQKRVVVAGRPILICRSEGQWFAIADRCSHDLEALHGGTIRKCSITCPHHGARFDLRTGRPYGPPAFDAVRIYPVRLEAGRISVSLAPAQAD